MLGFCLFFYVHFVSDFILIENLSLPLSLCLVGSFGVMQKYDLELQLQELEKCLRINRFGPGFTVDGQNVRFSNNVQWSIEDKSVQDCEALLLPGLKIFELSVRKLRPPISKQSTFLEVNMYYWKGDLSQILKFLGHKKRLKKSSTIAYILKYLKEI